MVHIEFMGVPGVGKTTLAERLAEGLREQGGNVAFLPMDDVADLSRWGDRARHLSGIARYALAMPQQTWRSAKVARAFPQPTWATAVKTLGYWLATHRLAHEYAQRAEVVVLDQGYFQGIYSWALQSTALDEASLSGALKLIPIPDIVVVVTAPVAVIRARLEHRAHTHKMVDRLLRDHRALEKSADLVARIEQAGREAGCTIVRYEGAAGTSVHDSAARLLEALRYRCVNRAMSTEALSGSAAQ